MLRKTDIFVKPREDLRTKSAAGGLITIIASTTAVLLFLGQIYLYIVGSTTHRLQLSESLAIPMLPTTHIDPFQSRLYDTKGKMPLKIHLTFPHIDCSNLDVKLNGQPLKYTDFDYRKTERKVNYFRPNPVELKQAGFPGNHKGGCTIRTTLRVPIVAGHLTITLNRQAWTKALNRLMFQSQQLQQDQETTKNDYNVTHYIHTIQFGKRFHKAAAYPLENRYHIIENKMGGIAVEDINVKLVPTIYNGWITSHKSYQMSVSTHTVQPETMIAQGATMLPGLALGYDVTPLAVHHDDGRDNIIVFISSLVSIVGGVFVTVGLFTGCLVHSAAVVAKKTD